jgi:O-antigen ligase
LDLWTRLGILGLASGLWLLTTAFRQGWSLSRCLPEADEQALALGLLASLVATVAHGLIDNSFFLVDLMFVFMMTLGLIRAMDDLRGKAIHSPSLRL